MEILSFSGSVCISDQEGFDIHHTHCFIKRTFTPSGIKIERGGVKESECINNKALSSINNPYCKLPHPPDNTVCYDCCQQLDCDRDSLYCNKRYPIDVKFIPAYMKTGN